MKILIVKLTHWCNLKLHEHVQTWKLIRGEFQWTLSDFLYKSLRMRKMPWRGLIWFVGISGVKFHENSIKGSGAIKETPWWTSLLVSCKYTGYNPTKLDTAFHQISVFKTRRNALFLKHCSSPL